MLFRVNAISNFISLPAAFLSGVCPGFGQNRVNFHRNPGRGTAGGWGLTPPGQTEPGIPYHVTSRWVPVGGTARREGTRGLGGRGAGPVSGERLLYGSWLCFLLICIVVVPVFPLFAVLLNCPYPDPPVFCLFLFILLRTPAEGGAAAWRFCCWRQPKPKH